MRILIATFTFISVAASGQKKILILQTLKANNTDKAYKEILITGEGNMQAKMYLQNVSAELVEALKEMNIHCRYEYLGDRYKVDTEDAYAHARSEQYDAVLRMVPRSTEESLVAINNAFADDATKRIAISRADLGLRSILRNDFDFVLREKSDSVIWEGRLKTDIDPTARNVYKKIASKMITELSHNKIVPGK